MIHWQPAERLWKSHYKCFFKVAVSNFHPLDASRWFPHRCSEGCQCVVVARWTGQLPFRLPYAICLNEPLIHYQHLSSKSATRVTTLWLKQPICFCSNIYIYIGAISPEIWYFEIKSEVILWRKVLQYSMCGKTLCCKVYHSKANSTFEQQQVEQFTTSVFKASILGV